ncbi:hypothetical protein [Burkholderia ubonensis]|nr:hypothetical protein [Burkholderia ubonensis]
MKRLYARLVLWLVQPALELRSNERAPTVAQLDALSARIDNERAARQIADAALSAKFAAQSREL